MGAGGKLQRDAFAAWCAILDGIVAVAGTNIDVEYTAGMLAGGVPYGDTEHGGAVEGRYPTPWPRRSRRTW